MPGRQEEINKATMMTCNFAKTTATTRFNITCSGGCTNIISVGFLTVGVKHSLYKQNTMLSSWLDDNIYGLHSHCKCCIHLILVHNSGNYHGRTSCRTSYSLCKGFRQFIWERCTSKLYALATLKFDSV